MMELLFANGELMVPLFTPPGVPASRLAALRAAFKRTIEDPALMEEGLKQKMEAQFVSGEEVADADRPRLRDAAVGGEGDHRCGG